MMNELTPRRILMTVDALGGVWTYAVELARALAPRGVEIVFAQHGRRSLAGAAGGGRGLRGVVREPVSGSSGWTSRGQT